MATKDSAVRGYSSTARKVMVLGADGITQATNSNPLPTSATISGDIDVSSSSVDTSGYIGKASGTNGDFTTAYASATSITASSLPTDVNSLTNQDIITVVQITSAGVATTFSRDDQAINCSGTDPTTITVAGATFSSSDTFIIYTNIAKPQASSGGFVYSTDGTSTNSDYGLIDGDGHLQVDVLSSVGDSFVYSTDGTSANSDYGLIDGDGHIQVDVLSSSLDDTTATIGTTEVQRVAIFDDNNSQITSFGSAETEEEVDEVAPAKREVVGYVANTSVPTAVSDGDVVDLFVDEYGRQIIAGYNISENALNVSNISSIPKRTIFLEMFDSVTSDQESAAINTIGLSKHNFQITSSAVTTGFDFYIWESNDNINWTKIYTKNVTTNETITEEFNNASKRYLKVEMDNRTDGTLTVTYGGLE